MELGDKGGLGATGIVNLLYVDPPAQGRGIGRALMGEGARWLGGKVAGPMVLSAYELNPFRHAYRAMGGREAARLTSRFGTHKLASVLYLWDYPRNLVAT
jgi:GNAT superfamily N-acetyltransferase